MKDIPVQLRLTVDHMKQEMVHCLSKHSFDLERMIAEQVEQVMTPEYVNEVLKIEVRRLIKDLVKEKTSDLVKWTVSNVFWDDEAKELLRKVLVKELTKILA